MLIMEDKVELYEQAGQLEQEYLKLELEGAEPDALEKISEKYFLLLEEIRSDELRDEIEWAAILIENSDVEPNVFNTFEWVNNCVKQLEFPLETSTYLADIYPSNSECSRPSFAEKDDIFDDDWRGLDTLECFGKYRSETVSADEDFEYKENGVYFNPLDYLLSTIRGGGVPRPELLLSLAKAFDLYFSRGGDLSLEEVFFGKPTKLGNYAKRSVESFKGINFKQVEHCVRRKEFSSIGATAERFIELKMVDEPDGNLEPEDLDALLRKYRRWKIRQGIKSKPLST